MEEERQKLIVKIDMALENNREIFYRTYSKESDFQNKLIKVLSTLFGKDIWFTKVSDRYIKGVPDIVGCIAGKFFALELKRDKGKPSALQLYNIDRIEKAGGKACIVRTVAESLWTIRSLLMQ